MKKILLAIMLMALLPVTAMAQYDADTENGVVSLARGLVHLSEYQ